MRSFSQLKHYGKPFSNLIATGLFYEDERGVKSKTGLKLEFQAPLTAIRIQSQVGNSLKE